MKRSSVVVSKSRACREEIDRLKVFCCVVPWVNGRFTVSAALAWSNQHAIHSHY